METLNQVFSTNWSYINVLLPLGISFFTFQQISYLVDCFREKNPDYQLLDYALFVSFFPQLIAGPIVTHKEIIPQFQDLNKQHFHAENFSK
jgi:alginate O-acetyltransferase complex protein AlgI